MTSSVTKGKTTTPVTQAGYDWKFWRNPENYSKDLPLLKVAITEWAGNTQFKNDFELNPKKALAEKGWESVDILSLQILTDPQLAVTYKNDSEKTPPLVKEYRQFIAAKKLHAMSIRDTDVKDERWRKWRERMVLSTLWREGPSKYSKLVHAPFTIELTEGCSVGCWFCGVDAEKYQKPVELNDNTKKLFRSILNAFDELAGTECAQNGFLYWATDPLDHPEYEWFLEEFHNILGYWPQTTTAQGMKHAPRLRKMFEYIKTKNAFVQRFSMIRPKDLKEIREYFTPEELFLCEQIPQYDNEKSPKATSGRTRKLVLKKQERGQKINFDYDLEDTGSIACVSGFLINLVSQSIKLITPCNASDEWPLGYRILGQARFNDGESVFDTIISLINQYIEDSLKVDNKINLHRGVKVSHVDSTTLNFSRYGYVVSLKNLRRADLYCRYLSEGDLSMREICMKLSAEGVDAFETMTTLYKVRDFGVIDEGNV